MLILAHSDDEGRLTRLLKTWALPRAKAVVLLFCSSGHYQLVSGPFVDGPALTIRGRMAEGSIVVGSRVPVEPGEAMRFGQFVLDRAAEHPVAELATAYVRQHLPETPFHIPWVALS